MQLINKISKPSSSKRILSFFIIIFLIIVTTITIVVGQNTTDITESLNSTVGINEIVDKAVLTDTTREFIRHISNKVFLPAVATYWIIQFILILIIGLATVREDKDTYFIIFVVTQLIGAMVLFFIFILPVIPQFIEKIIDLV